MPRSHHSLRAPRSFARLALFCGILLAILPAAAPAHAEEIDWKAGKLGHLAPHIGTYRYDAVLGDPAVKATLEALVGADLAAVIATNLTVAGPIDFVGGHLVLRGLAPHQGGEEEAIVLIKIFDGTLRAALLHEGRMRLFAPDAEYRYLPPPLKEFVRPRDDTFYPSAPPPGVEWLREPRG
ncbi:MAG TPA: hypothetical protein VIS03_15445 [Kiloniellaceae bacterium]